MCSWSTSKCAAAEQLSHFSSSRFTRPQSVDTEYTVNTLIRQSLCNQYTVNIQSIPSQYTVNILAHMLNFIELINHKTIYFHLISTFTTPTQRLHANDILYLYGQVTFTRSSDWPVRSIVAGILTSFWLLMLRRFLWRSGRVTWTLWASTTTASSRDTLVIYSSSKWTSLQSTTWCLPPIAYVGVPVYLYLSVSLCVRLSLSLPIASQCLCIARKPRSSQCFSFISVFLVGSGWQRHRK